MAFTRRSLGALGLSEEQVDKVMALHGTSMSDFIPKSELQEKIDLALADAQKNALQNVKVKETDEYKAVADGFRMDVISLISKNQRFPDGQVTGAYGEYGDLTPYCENGPRVHE